MRAVLDQVWIDAIAPTPVAISLKLPKRRCEDLLYDYVYLAVSPRPQAKLEAAISVSISAQLRFQLNYVAKQRH